MSAGDHLPAHPGAKCNPGQKVSSSFKARFTPLRPAFPCWGTGLRLGSQLLAEVLCPGPTSMCIRHTLFPLLLFLEFPWPRFGLGWPQGLAPSAQFPVFFLGPLKGGLELSLPPGPSEPALGDQGPGHASHRPLLSDPPQHGPWCYRRGRLWAGAPRGHWMTSQLQDPAIYDSRSSAPTHRGTGRCFLPWQPRSRSFGQSLPALGSGHALLPTPNCLPTSPLVPSVHTVPLCIPPSMMTSVI